MSTPDLRNVYQGYIQCLNQQNWSALGDFVSNDVHYNGKRIGVSGYRDMLERDFKQIPDLHFTIALLVADSATVASRLQFACSPSGVFLGLAVNGRHVHFTENVFYQFEGGKIAHVWSVIDKAAIESQL
ncbi:MAG: ester cyclase [Pseudomonas sp.]|uniref:ester cyclase n=1 Tax=Pseudomonas abieticivorans TaxID=2931382 RepID=UPI0020C02AA5|nr:ester cyclase [Pseudomonas sp. PIA16]MDE1167801.1 ester cyclase [Pseudomonas sp.]